MLSNGNQNAHVQAYKGFRILVRSEEVPGKHRIAWCLYVSYPFTGDLVPLAFGFISAKIAIECGKKHIDEFGEKLLIRDEKEE